VDLKGRSDSCVSYGILIIVGLGCVLVGCFAGESQAEKGAGEEANGNSKCYVCHAGLKEEEITISHVGMGITCDECHGPSIEHMHDEMLMTMPDLLFGRSEVRGMCSDPTCHKPGEGRYVYGLQDHKDTKVVETFYKKWLGRARPNGRTVTADSVCTDCHGKHNLDKATGGQFEDQQDAQWVSAFNGRDLSGWRASAAGSWTVKSGRLTGTAAENAKGSSLWSEEEYEDYQMAVTFRATRPVRAGIWLRGDGSKPGARVEIFESDKPEAFTGSVLVPNKGLVLVNLRSDLLDGEGWNTISAKVEGGRVQVWLNAEEIGAVRTGGPAKGKIGLYVGPGSEAGHFVVRELLIQKLAKSG